MFFAILAFTAALYCLVQLQPTAVTLLCESLQLQGTGTLLKLRLCRAELEICYYAALCLSPDKRWWESWLLPSRQDSLLVSLFLPVANPSSSVIRPPMSSSFLSQQALFALAFVPCKYSPAKSLQDELLSVLCCYNISISHPCGSAPLPLSAPAMWVLLAEQPLESTGPWAAGCSGAGGGGHSTGWVMLCSIYRFAAPQVCHCHLVLGRLDACTWLWWGYLPGLHHYLLKLVARKGWWCFWRDVLSFQSNLLLLMLVIAGSLLNRSVRTPACFPHTATFPKDQTWICAAIYKRLDIKSINGSLHSCKFSYPVIFPFRQERCENHVDSEAGLGVSWLQPWTAVPSPATCVNGRAN